MLFGPIVEEVIFDENGERASTSERTFLVIGFGFGGVVGFLAGAFVTLVAIAARLA